MAVEIVVVDDDLNLVGYIREVFAHRGYRIAGVCSARDALQVVVNTDPDLVILDILMPHIDGGETCRRLRTISDVPILVFTVLGGNANAAKGLGLGADDYLDKLCRVEELRARVEALLRRSKRSPASREPRLHVVGDELSVDFEKRAAIVRGQMVELTPDRVSAAGLFGRTTGKGVGIRRIVARSMGLPRSTGQGADPKSHEPPAGEVRWGADRLCQGAGLSPAVKTIPLTAGAPTRPRNCPRTVRI